MLKMRTQTLLRRELGQIGASLVLKLRASKFGLKKIPSKCRVMAPTRRGSVNLPKLMLGRVKVVVKLKDRRRMNSSLSGNKERNQEQRWAKAGTAGHHKQRWK